MAWLLINDLAKLLDIDVRCVRRHLYLGHFPHTKRGNTIFFNPDQVEYIQEWMRTHPPVGLATMERKKEWKERWERLKAKGIVKDPDPGDAKFWLDRTPAEIIKKGGEKNGKKD